MTIPLKDLCLLSIYRNSVPQRHLQRIFSVSHTTLLISIAPFLPPSTKTHKLENKRIEHRKIRTQFHITMVLRLHRFYSLTSCYLCNMSIFTRSPFPPPHCEYPLSNLPINLKLVPKKSVKLLKKNTSSCSYGLFASFLERNGGILKLEPFHI